MAKKGKKKSLLGSPIGKKEIVTKDGEVKTINFYSPNKRSKLYLSELKLKKKVDKKGHVVKMTSNDNAFRKGYLLAQQDNAAMHNFKITGKVKKHRA